MIRYAVFTAKTLSGLDSGGMNPVEIYSEFIVTAENFDEAYKKALIVAEAEDSEIYSVSEVVEEE